MNELRKFTFKQYMLFSEASKPVFFEGDISNEVSGIIRNALIETYPEKYKAHKIKHRIYRNPLDVTLEDIYEDLKNIGTIESDGKFKIDIILEGSPEILGPKEGSGSGKFSILKFKAQINGKDIVPVGIMLAVVGDFPTDAKEGLPGIFYSLGIRDQVNDLESFKNLLTTITNKLQDNQSFDSLNMDSNTFAKSQKSLNNILIKLTQNSGKLTSKLKNQLNMINEYISISAALYDRDYTPDTHIYDRNNYYKLIRNAAKNITGLTEINIWSPADTYLINKSKLGEIDTAVNKAMRLKDINIINKLFSNDVEDDAPIFGVSLKQLESHTGKAKWYLEHKFKSIEYRLTDAELTEEDPMYFINKIYETIPNIERMVALIGNVEINDNETLTPEKLQELSVDELRKKYGALKQFEFILRNSKNNPSIFIDLLKAGMKISDDIDSPAFVKIIGNPKGRAPVKPQDAIIMELNGPVMVNKLYSLSYKGVMIYVPVLVSREGTTSEDMYRIMIRSTGNKQMAIETGHA